jgi:hypothetical protein
MSSCGKHGEHAGASTRTAETTRGQGHSGNGRSLRVSALMA